MSRDQQTPETPGPPGPENTDPAASPAERPKVEGSDPVPGGFAPRHEDGTAGSAHEGAKRVQGAEPVPGGFAPAREEGGSGRG